MTVDDPQTLTNGPSLHCRARFSCSIPQLDIILTLFLDTYLSWTVPFFAAAGTLFQPRCSQNLPEPLYNRMIDECFYFHGDGRGTPAGYQSELLCYTSVSTALGSAPPSNAMSNQFSFSRPGRPAYLDGLYSSQQPQSHSSSHSQSFPHHPRTPSLTRSHRSNESVSTSRTNSIIDSYGDSYAPTRPLTPAFEEQIDAEDAKSLIQVTRSLKPRLKLRAPVFRRTNSPRPASDGSPCADSPTLGSHKMHGSNKSLPALPTYAQQQKHQQEAKSPGQELSCQRCYYFAARHCNGWVMGGSHGDACESCLVSRSCMAISKSA